MGQKVNPTSLRLGIIKGYESSWYAPKKDFGKKLLEDNNIRKVIKQYIQPEILSRIIIERSLKKIIVTIHTSKPGLIIGLKGVRIGQLTDKLRKKYGNDFQINTFGIKFPELDAHLLAQSIAIRIKARGSYRSAVKQAISSAMRIGATGVSVTISGRLSGAEIARSEKMKEGRVPRHTLRADIDYAKVSVKTVYGIIGIKLAIFTHEVYGKRDLSLNLETFNPKKYRGEKKQKMN